MPTRVRPRARSRNSLSAEAAPRVLRDPIDRAHPHRGKRPEGHGPLDDADRLAAAEGARIEDHEVHVGRTAGEGRRIDRDALEEGGRLVEADVEVAVGDFGTGRLPASGS